MTLKPVRVEIAAGYSGPQYVTVYAIWDGVDRPRSHGIQVRTSLAARLERAILDGVVFTDPHIARDVNGQTLVQSPCAVMAKYANADLKRLGY
jgi:hypothetical protein